jgi:hypothetical protein
MHMDTDSYGYKRVKKFTKPELNTSDVTNVVVWVMLFVLLILYPFMGWIDWRTFWFVFFVRWSITIERYFAIRFRKEDE